MYSDLRSRAGLWCIIHCSGVMVLYVQAHPRVEIGVLCVGQYIHRNLPTRVLNPIDLWLNYPHIPLAGPFKFYYLSQTAFYLHQILILNAEARRKDHVQMMTHHIITVILMWTSYFTNFTRVGALIMVLMDWCDIFLPVSY